MWPAPAKVNLFLHVVGRRPDGRHELQTVFRFLDFCDELSFTVTADGGISRCTPVPGLPPEQDLCVRAARLLQRVTGARQGTIIGIHKQIPAGAGLGGGSSDAATTLLALNHLWGAGLTPTHLAALGLELGADVPVFVHGRAAWGEGVGERLTPIELPPAWYVVLVPPVHVSTADVFSRFVRDRGSGARLTPYSPPIKIRRFRDGGAGNDLEAVVRQRYPAVDQALDWLSRFGPARMSGSGGAVFLELADEQVARAVVQRLPEHLKDCRVIVARGLDRSPVLERLARGRE